MSVGFDGILGDGVKIGYRGGSPVQWVGLFPLADVPSIPAAEADELENTSHGSGGFHTFRLGLKKVPNVSCKLYFDASDDAHLAMIDAQAASTVLSFRIEVPASETSTTVLSWEFDAYVKKANITTGIAAIQMLELDLLYSGNLVVVTTPEASEILYSSPI